MSNTITDHLIPISRNLAGDFIGFTFDNIHSSDFNLVRVSDGSRYESNLLPSFQDATIQGEGKDGMFYFGSNFKERPIKISTAFDELTEENYRSLTETFSSKKIHKLWFDETPYKVYYVKLKTAPTFKNICFDEYYEENGKRKTRRLYRGEMDLDFVSYSVWAEARASHLNQRLPEKEFVLVNIQEEQNQNLFHNHFLVGENTDGMVSSLTFTHNQFYKYYGKDGATLADSYNFEEWKASSLLEKTNTIKQIKAEDGIIETIVVWESENQETKETTESFEWSEGVSLPIYNPGMTAADVKIIFTPKEGTNKFPNTQLVLYTVSNQYSDLTQLEEKTRIGIKSFDIGNEDTHIVIDSKTHLISGMTVDQDLSGNIYNKFHINGDFFEIPKSKYKDGLFLKIECSDAINCGTWRMEYKFYYV